MIDRYVGRAARLGPVRVAPLSASRASHGARQSREDSDSLRQAAGRGEAVLLTPRGQMWSTEQLASYVRDRLDRGTSATTFALGGEAGFVPDDEKWATHRLGLSAMTLPHELARVVMAEQLYRALTIIRNVKYHK